MDTTTNNNNITTSVPADIQLCVNKAVLKQKTQKQASCSTRLGSFGFDPDLDMRFTSNARPSLTPLGHKLLHLSEVKLSNLDSPLGGREIGSAMWKGVVVREAVKSAWKSVETDDSEMTDWRSQGAMGLDVISEDEEEEAVTEDKWFDNLLSTLGEDEEYDFGSHEWAESSVCEPVLDDLEYDVEDIQAYTIPSSPPSSPPSQPAILPVSVTTLTATTSPVTFADTYTYADDTEVAIVEVEDVDDIDDCECEECHVARPEMVINRGDLVYPTQPVILRADPLLSATSSTTTSPCESPMSDITECDLDWEEPDDNFLLPPPLHRSSYSSSSSATDENEIECQTPVQTCEDLEEVVRAEMMDSTETTLDKVGEKLDLTLRFEAGLAKRSLGLGFEVGLESV